MSKYLGVGKEHIKPFPEVVAICQNSGCNRDPKWLLQKIISAVCKQLTTFNLISRDFGIPQG